MKNNVIDLMINERKRATKQLAKLVKAVRQETAEEILFQIRYALKFIIQEKQEIEDLEIFLKEIEKQYPREKNK